MMIKAFMLLFFFNIFNLDFLWLLVITVLYIHNNIREYK